MNDFEFKWFADNLQIKEPMIMTDEWIARRFIMPEYNSLPVLTPREPRDVLIDKVAQVDAKAAQWLRENKEIMHDNEDALGRSFVWSSTPQGPRFWSDLNAKICNIAAQILPAVSVAIKHETDADRACRLEHERIKEKFYPAPRRVKRDFPDLRPWPPAWLAPIGEE